MRERLAPEEAPADASWRSLCFSSSALSLCLFGDALIYIVLPVNADAFGISLVWVGVLLSANRFVRTVTYGLIAHLGEIIGVKRLCVLATATAIISTALYGILEGGPALTGARMLWGVSYAGLLLVTLGYAAADRGRTGTRVGVSRAIEQFGPLFALTAGTWLAGIFGPRDVFLLLALLSCVGLVLAMMLPPSSPRPATAGSRPGWLPKPDRLDLLIFWMGFGVDGVFTMTLTIMLAVNSSVELAMVSAGLLIAGRRVAEIVIAPLSGAIADRFGVRTPLVFATIVLVFGFLFVGIEWLYTGALLLMISRGMLGTLFPATVARFAPSGVLFPLARNQTWRDIGAALGPRTTGFLLGVTSPEWLHLGLAVIVFAGLLWLVSSAQWRRGTDA